MRQRFASVSTYWNARSRPQQWLLLVPVVVFLFALPVLNPEGCPFDMAETAGLIAGAALWTLRAR